MPRVEFTYVAIKPIRAEHPAGTGIIVEYAPGDVVPAGDWGRAADNLVEVGKVMRYAVNIDDLVSASIEIATGDGLAEASQGEDVQTVPGDDVDEGSGDDADAVGVAVGDGDETQEPVQYPVAATGNWFLLSDGSKVNGRKRAMIAQAALDVAAETQEPAGDGAAEGGGE